MKKTERKLNWVFKEDPKLNKAWKKKMEAILQYIKIPALVSFTSKGYITRYINGVDLQEDKPFQYRHDIVRAYPLNEIQRRNVIRIFRDIVYAGIKTNYTLADFTKRNIIMEGNTPYLIDYDVIIKGELPGDYIDLFQKMLDYLKIDYQFNGNRKELYELLSKPVSY